MRRTALLIPTVVALAVTVLFPAPGLAGDLEKAMEGRWRGARALTLLETHADCLGLYTNNRVNGRLVSSAGRQHFRAGELVRVDKVDAKRSRLDLLVTLEEPLLVSYQDGPFTLYKEARCQAELQVEVPRTLVSGKKVDDIDTALRGVLERYATAEEAERSRAWNRRERASYPADYEETLARHAAWKAEQVNARVQARLDRAMEESGRVADRLNGDPEYLKGFAAGVEGMKSARPEGCEDLMARDFAKLPATRGGVTYASGGAAPGGEAPNHHGRGFQDGQRLVLALELIRGLPACFVRVPAVPPASR
jgi:hypothetical protein